jgi:hypothetical protein
MAQMQNNMSFTTMNYKGGQTINAVPVEGQGQVVQTRGGVFSITAANDTYDAVFGTVVSALATAPTDFLIGSPVTAAQPTVGIVMWDASIAQNDPAKNNYYLKGNPMTACYGGLLRFQSWTKGSTGAIDPIIGCKVIFNQTTGVIEFIAQAASPQAGWLALIVNGIQAQVVETDPDGRFGVVIKL